jgi:Holliday junction resolvase RusA-like endonuclease
VLGEWWTIEPLDEVRCLLLSFRGPARGDLDNLAGAVLDAGNGLIWRDDRVGVLPTLALRWTKTHKEDQSIYIKVIWE